MAIVKLGKDGYGQLELNHVAFRRDGRIEAQCALNATDFATDKAENGMLLAVDKVNRQLKKATLSNADDLVVGLNYSSELIYDERTPGLKNFALGLGEFLPRIGMLAARDTFHTNTVCYDTDDYADEDAIKLAVEGNATTAAAPVYAGIATDGSGYWQLSDAMATFTAGPVAQVVEFATMPDGQTGLKLYVIKA